MCSQVNIAGPVSSRVCWDNVLENVPTIYSRSASAALLAARDDFFCGLLIKFYIKTRGIDEKKYTIFLCFGL